MTLQDTKFTSFPGTTINGRGGLTRQPLLGDVAGQGQPFKGGAIGVGWARQQNALQVRLHGPKGPMHRPAHAFHIGIVPFENLKGQMAVLVLPYGKSGPARNSLLQS